tara:strand:- start:436 stop:822 length:387 start_codon:yes stop_codon:yes gene_type:complete
MGFQAWLLFSIVVGMGILIDGVAEESATGLTVQGQAQFNSMIDAEILDVSDETLNETPLNIDFGGNIFKIDEAWSNFYDSITLNYDWFKLPVIIYFRYMWLAYCGALILYTAFATALTLLGGTRFGLG